MAPSFALRLAILGATVVIAARDAARGAAVAAEIHGRVPVAHASASPSRRQPGQVSNGRVPLVVLAREQLIRLLQYKRVWAPLPPGIVPYRQLGRVDLAVHVPPPVLGQRPLEALP
jgi:hypothetical protein